MPRTDGIQQQADRWAAKEDREKQLLERNSVQARSIGQHASGLLLDQAIFLLNEIYQHRSKGPKRQIGDLGNL